MIYLEAYSRRPRGWDALEIPGWLTRDQLLECRRVLRELVKDRVGQLGFTSNDWCTRVIEQALRERRVTGFDLLAIKMPRVRVGRRRIAASPAKNTGVKCLTRAAHA